VEINVDILPTLTFTPLPPPLHDICQVVGYSSDGVSISTLDPAELKKYARRITEDRKRALVASAGVSADAGGIGGGAIAATGGSQKAAGVQAGAKQEEESGDAEAGEEGEEGQCGECGAHALGAVDLSNNCFYCNACWASFQVRGVCVYSCLVGLVWLWMRLSALVGRGQILMSGHCQQAAPGGDDEGWVGAEDDEEDVIGHDNEEANKPPTLKRDISQFDAISSAPVSSMENVVGRREGTVGSSSVPPLSLMSSAARKEGWDGEIKPPSVPAFNSLGGKAVVADADGVGDEVEETAGSIHGEIDAYMVTSGDANAPSMETMCSKHEYDRRQNTGRGANFSEMERDPTTKEPLWPELVVSRYQHSRGGAGAAFTGANMRTLRAMQDTITHLEKHWMTKEMIDRAPGGYAGVYKVLHDALKSISADMAFLRQHYAASLIVANVFERVIRIALDAHYRLSEDLSVATAAPAAWAEEWLQTHGIPNQMGKKEGMQMSRSAQGGTAMGSHEDYIYKNLNTLVKDIYPELRSKGISVPTEAEFVAYYILKLSMRGGHQKDEQDLYHSLSQQARQSAEVGLLVYLHQDVYISILESSSIGAHTSGILVHMRMPIH
jgi:hypothetical protein